MALLVRERWELALALALEAHWLVGLPQMFNVYASGVLPGCVRRRKQGTQGESACDDAPAPPLPARPHLTCDECVMLRAMSCQAILGPADLGGRVLVRRLFFQTTLHFCSCRFDTHEPQRSPCAHTHSHQHMATRTIDGQID